MNILNDYSEPTAINKAEVEQVQDEKQEYYLLGTYLRTRGLKLFGYNWMKNEIFEVIIQYGDTIHLKVIDNKLVPIDLQAEKCTVDSRHTYFEALNYKTAKKRVKNYLSGNISELCNLRVPSKEGIKFF